MNEETQNVTEEPEDSTVDATSDASPDSDMKSAPWLLTHCSRWANAYQAAGVLSIVVAIIIGGMSINQTQDSLDLALQALQQNAEALEISREALAVAGDSLDIQQKEFRLRNRPIVILRNARFAGASRDVDGREFPRSVCVDVVNISEIPANRLKGECKATLNGKKLFSTFLSPCALAKGGNVGFNLFLHEHQYVAATNTQNRFEVEVAVTYSGLLGEQDDAYSTSEVLYYSLPENTFKFEQIEYK